MRKGLVKELATTGELARYLATVAGLVAVKHASSQSNGAYQPVRLGPACLVRALAAWGPSRRVPRRRCGGKRH